MLLLTRKTNESFIIEVEGSNEPIEIKILDVNNQVRLGIKAPKNCKIWREELYQTIQENNHAVAKGISAANLKDIAKKIVKHN